MPIPDKIANAPDLQFGNQFYYLGFMELTTCRGQGYGSEGVISWLVINDYCMVNEIEGEQREDFFYHISKMDAAYLDYKTKKLRKANEEG